MSTVREAHIPKELEKKMSKTDGSAESAIKIYEECAQKALESGDAPLHDSYMQIAQDMRDMIKSMKERGLDYRAPVVFPSGKDEEA